MNFGSYFKSGTIDGGIFPGLSGGSFQAPGTSFTYANSVNFNGSSSHLRLPVGINTGWTTAQSWMWWVKISSSQTGDTGIWDSYNGTPNNGTQFYLTGGRFEVWYYASNNTWFTRLVSSYPTDTWTHIVVTYSGSAVAAGVKIYYNGTLQSMSTSHDNLSIDNLPTSTPYIGAQSGTTNFLSGRMNQLAVYGTELDQTAVTALYNGGVPVDLSTLASYSNIRAWYQMGNYSSDSTSTIINSANPGTYDATATSITIVTDSP